MPKENIDELIKICDEIQKDVESINPSQQLENLVGAIGSLNDDISRFSGTSDPAKNTSEIRKRLNKILENSSPWRKYKDEGYLALKEERQRDFLRLNEVCKQYGIFIVPYGELESWLVPYGIDKTSNKSNWIVTALTKLPEFLLTGLNLYGNS